MSELLTAATALQAEIDKFAETAQRLADQPLRSKKHLERAGRMLQEIADSEDRIGECLRTLNQKLLAAHGLHTEHANKVQADALNVQARTRAFEALMLRFNALGVGASELNASTQEEAPDLPAMDTKVSAVLAEAEAIYSDARAADFMDVATDADSMRQQLSAVRTKLRKLLA